MPQAEDWIKLHDRAYLLPMGVMNWLADVSGFGVTDTPGGRSIFGPFEPFVALGTPFFGDGEPSEEDLGDALIDAGGAAGPVGSGGLAGPALKEGKKNVRDYIDNSPRAGRKKLDDIIHNSRGDVPSDD